MAWAMLTPLVCGSCSATKQLPEVICAVGMGVDRSISGFDNTVSGCESSAHIGGDEIWGQ